MVVDIGGDARRKSSRSAAWFLRARCVGGDKFDEAIVNYIRHNYGC
jgi:actin-like ATPase involved in cell morphogenesis